MEQSQHTFSLQAHHSKAILHSLQIQSTTMSPPPFIISPITSSFPFLSFLDLTSTSALLRSSYLSEYHQSYTCGLQSALWYPSPFRFILFQCQPPISILYSTATLHLPFIPLFQKLLPISIHILRGWSHLWKCFRSNTGFLFFQTSNTQEKLKWWNED